MRPLSQDALCVSDMRAVALCRLVTGVGHCGKACDGPLLEACGGDTAVWERFMVGPAITASGDEAY